MALLLSFQFACCRAVLILDLSLTIQKSSLDFDSDRTIDVYFSPVSLNGGTACLQMNFTALTYFAVKLAYANASTSEYKERLLFRSVESLEKQFRFWETDITPDMTEGEEFVVVLHARSSSLGAMAIINEINLQMAKCSGTGNFLCRAEFRVPKPQIDTKEFINGLIKQSVNGLGKARATGKVLRVGHVVRYSNEFS